MKYMSEPWFELLQGAAKTHTRQGAALLLGVSAPQVSQVLNGTGKYGTGEAGTGKLAEKVMHTFGRYPCPHLSQQSGFGDQAVVITAEECRAYAHRPAPTGSPRDMQHWQACNGCPHKAHTAPPPARDVKPRKNTPKEGT
jgi:DNA-binding transcriptional regulator YdaS (Cro superfamily)